MAADGGHDGGVEVDALLYLGGTWIPGHDEEVEAVGLKKEVLILSRKVFVLRSISWRCAAKDAYHFTYLDLACSSVAASVAILTAMEIAVEIPVGSAMPAIADVDGLDPG